MKYFYLLFFVILQSLGALEQNLNETLVVPSWFGEQMVLPANHPLQLTGKAKPGSKVEFDYDSLHLTTEANQNGEWSISLPSLDTSSKELPIKISSNGQTKTFPRVVVGQIWLCAGQSNMAMPIRATKHEMKMAEKEIQTVDIRYYDGASWLKLDAENMAKLSAVGIWFAIETAKRTNGPVSLSVAARGGTGIESWIPTNSFPSTEYGKKMKSLATDPAVLKAAEEDAKDPKPYGQHRLAQWGMARGAPAWMFAKSVTPLNGLPVQGTVWYQGESNAMSFMSQQEYLDWLKGLINGWRNNFNNPDMSFVIIQLPEYDARTEAFERGWVTEPVKVNQSWADIQMAQQNISKEMKGVCSVSTKGLGELKNIHPRNKKEVARRAAALSATYRK